MLEDLTFKFPPPYRVGLMAPKPKWPPPETVPFLQTAPASGALVLESISSPPRQLKSTRLPLSPPPGLTVHQDTDSDDDVSELSPLEELDAEMDDGKPAG